jgi:nucleotide-binding universal stress UspA family protein
VVASGRVTRDHPVAVLVAQSAAQHLLVVRSRARHPLEETFLDSITLGVLQYATCPVATCPVAVIPAAMRRSPNRCAPVTGR